MTDVKNVMRMKLSSWGRAAIGSVYEISKQNVSFGISPQKELFIRQPHVPSSS